MMTDRMFITIAFWALFDMVLALLFGGMIPLYSGSVRWFAVPFAVHSLTSSALAVSAIFRAERRTLARVVFGSLPLTSGFAMVQWSGGDDGAGMLWFLFLGIGSVLGLLFAIVTLLVPMGRKTK